MKQIKLFLALAVFLSAFQTIFAQVGGLTVSAPASVAGEYKFISLTNGWGKPANLCDTIVILKDTSGASLACLPPVNSASLAGKIVYLERGTCGFSVKVLTAQKAGASGVIIGNSAAAVPGSLGVTAAADFAAVTIPVAMISNTDGAKLKAALNAGEVVIGCMSVPNVKVAFTVDMKGQTVDPAGVFLAYSVEGDAVAARPMQNVGGTVYSDTLIVPATAEITYAYVNGTTAAGAENVPTACRVAAATNARYVYSGIAGGALAKVCFSSCVLCENQVTLKVNMSQKTVPATGVHVAGNFQGWDPATTAMTNAGNGIWTYTFAAKPGDTLQYKFVNGNAWGSDETKITAKCGISNGLGGFNRVFIVPNAETAAADLVCFDSCTACPAAECTPGALICDVFESYNLGGLNAQSANWDTWDGAGGDGIVTKEQASSGVQSLKIDFKLPGTTQDVVLLLGDSTKGNYTLKWKMFIPKGKKAYYNVQHTLKPAHIWASDVYFDADGAGRVAVGSTALGTFKYQYDKWINVEQVIDITNDVTYLKVSDTLSAVWKFSLGSNGTGGATTSKQLAGVDFYPVDTTYKWYVDDVQFIKLPAGVPSDFCINATDINSLFGKATGAVQNSALFNNTGATAVGDPKTGFSCFGEPNGGGAKPSLENSLWFTFKGDGNAYFIETAKCNATTANYINDGDSQIAIYEGTGCGALTPVLCNEDGPNATSSEYPAGDTLQTVAGKTYYMLVDGFAFNGAISDGQFCLNVKRMPPPSRAVTFQVDMSKVTLAASGAHIAGEFNGWTGEKMTDAGNGLWTFTTNLVEGDTIEYKFQNGSGGWENNLPAPCSLGSFGNRYVRVPTGAVTLPKVCFNSCNACDFVSISELSFNNGIQIAPNPTTGVTNIAVSLPESADLTIRVLNSIGQLVETRSENGIQSGNIRLEPGRYGKGIYFVELTDGVNRATRRVVVQ
jgi:hypothetical protein